MSHKKAKPVCATRVRQFTCSRSRSYIGVVFKIVGNGTRTI